MQNDKKFYTVTEIKNMLTIGTNKVYNLIKSEGFPSIKIGNKYIVPKDEFEKWVKTYTCKEVIVICQVEKTFIKELKMQKKE